MMQLRLHKLRDELLPLAPRQPFIMYSDESLESAAQLVRACPHKRGILSSVVREADHAGVTASVSGSITMELHFDSVKISPDLADALLRIGLEPDGFAEFNPPHFREHYTLKFKSDDTTNVKTRRNLWQRIEAARDAIRDLVTARWPRLECYVELELYGSRSRRTWGDVGLGGDWQRAFPNLGNFAVATNPNMGDFKHADIHAKLAKSTPIETRRKLTQRLIDFGFYRVVTWAGNEICTGQFASARVAKSVFADLSLFFDRHGGCVEMTLERVPSVWRNSWQTESGECFAAMPPLIL